MAVTRSPPPRPRVACVVLHWIIMSENLVVASSIYSHVDTSDEMYAHSEMGAHHEPHSSLPA